jgi:hypothetical protein
MTMFCPVCDRQLAADEFQPAVGDVPNRWVCGSCDCCVNEWDDEFEPSGWVGVEDGPPVQQTK